ncbi:MAG: hypothetical protein HOW73_33235, partial [Polyangiaceae bacterium]|nr:hypothetical protein [Polyangiaceae bacterium]
MSCEDSATKDRPRLFESGAVSLPNEDELTVIQATGIYSSADIWFSVPVAWKENVVIHLYARLGTMRVPLAIIAVRDVPSVEAGGMISGVAISTRGRPCSGFEVTIQRGPGVPTANGFIAMNAWSASESPEIVGGAPFGEFSFAPARGQVDVSLVGGKVGDAGEPNDRFAFLRVDGGGVVSVNVQDAVTVLPGAGNFGVEGTGTAGTPSGGVLTVQGTGTGGRVTVVGSEAGGALNVTVANDSFSVYGKETPADFSENPDNCVNVSAHLLGWGDEKWSRVGLTPAGDTVANPSNCVNAAGFIHGWDGSVWKRARMQTVSSVSAISNATAPAGVATAAFPYAYDAAGNQWLRTRCDGNGVLYTSQLGGNALADNLNFSGNLVPNSWALQAHRNQAGNWYLSRGGYNGVIAAAAVPAIANSIAAGAHNTTPPAPTNG